LDKVLQFLFSIAARLSLRPNIAQLSGPKKVNFVKKTGKQSNKVANK